MKRRAQARQSVVRSSLGIVQAGCEGKRAGKALLSTVEEWRSDVASCRGMERMSKEARGQYKDTPGGMTRRHSKDALRLGPAQVAPPRQCCVTRRLGRSGQIDA